MVNDIIFKTDLLIKDGDFVVGVSDEQHLEHILLAQPGDYKQAPWMGVGIESYLNAPFSPVTRQELEKEIKLQIDADGAKNTSVKINSFTDIQIIADYE